MTKLLTLKSAKGGQLRLFAWWITTKSSSLRSKKRVAQATGDTHINPSLTDLLEGVMNKAVKLGHDRDGLASVIEVLKTPHV